MAYLGEFPKQVKRAPLEWVGLLIEKYGGIDGDHHKAWVLDQIARVFHGAPVTVVEARWTDHEPEERATVGTSPAYEAWVAEKRARGYGYDTGIAP